MIQIFNRVTLLRLLERISLARQASCTELLPSTLFTWKPRCRPGSQASKDCTRIEGRSPLYAGATHKHVGMLQCCSRRWEAHHLL